LNLPQDDDQEENEMITNEEEAQGNLVIHFLIAPSNS
jgi:hypothetical protein